MLFIWVINMLGFIPLPLTGETYHGVPDLGHLRGDLVALGDARARAPDLRLHPLRGHPLERPGPLLQELDPRGAEGLLLLIVPLEILGQFMRLISLSVRLFANMLAGHILILTFIGLIFILETLVLIPVVIVATVFYLFEVVIVVTIQAFIFAALSAIYIGSAIEPEH